MITFLQRYLRQVRPLPPEDDAETLLARQDLRLGTLLTLLVALAAMAAWVQVSLLFDQYFPWVSMLQGIVIGLAMRRFGRGVDYRFPVVAATITMLAAVLGSFAAALFLTGREFHTPALSLINEISLHTVRTFLARDFGIIGVLYMGFAAALAAFFAKRRLRRNEAIALRRHREQISRGVRR